MDLYTLTDTFLAKDIVDDFVSAIWTERYSVAGDVQLVMPSTQENLDRLAPGVYLALRGTNEVMILETQSIEEQLLTVTGRTLDTFLDHRAAWFRNPASSVDNDSDRVVDYTDLTKKPGEFIADVVNKMVINTTPYTGEYANVNLDWDREEIPLLTLGAVDTSDVVKRITLPVGPLYTGIAEIALKEGVGFSLYLESADPISGYSLKFTTYRGVDHTSDQSVNPLIRLTPDFDSIQNLKEIRSNLVYRNVVYVYYQGIISEHLAEPSLPEPEGLERRTMVTNAEGEPVGRKVSYGRPGMWGGAGYTQVVVGPEEIAAFREQNAKDAFANNNYIRAIDGQTSPQNDYKYGIDYGLGDIIELQGLTGTITKARITEYIRTQDEKGEREYPTISVVD